MNSQVRANKIQQMKRDIAYKLIWDIDHIGDLANSPVVKLMPEQFDILLEAALTNLDNITSHTQ